MPSRVEGFGLAGLEAITSGTPVLISLGADVDDWRVAILAATWLLEDLKR
ncbi:hypothetical protein ABZZ80_35250 [Streptomyces sp. NPDC006356]